MRGRSGRFHLAANLSPATTSLGQVLIDGAQPVHYPLADGQSRGSVQLEHEGVDTNGNLMRSNMGILSVPATSSFPLATVPKPGLPAVGLGSVTTAQGADPSSTGPRWRPTSAHSHRKDGQVPRSSALRAIDRAGSRLPNSIPSPDPGIDPSRNDPGSLSARQDTSPGPPVGVVDDETRH